MLFLKPCRKLLLPLLVDFSWVVYYFLSLQVTPTDQVQKMFLVQGSVIRFSLESAKSRRKISNFFAEKQIKVGRILTVSKIVLINPTDLL